MSVRKYNNHLSRRRAAVRFVVGAAALSAMAEPLRAVDKTWIGPSGGNWSVPGNWSPNGAPQGGVFGERTFVDSTTPKTVFFDFDYPSAIPNSIELQSQPNNAVLTLQLNPNPGTKKFNVNSIAVGEQGTAQLIDSAQPIITNTLYVGFNSTGLGTLAISGTATVNAGYTSVGQVGFGNVNQSGSSLFACGNYELGNFGSAVHQMSGGTLSFANRIVSIGWHGQATLLATGGVVSGQEVWVAPGAADTGGPKGIGSMLISGTAHAALGALWVGLRPEPPPDPEDPQPPMGDIVGGDAAVEVAGVGASLQAGFINSRGTLSITNQGSLTTGTFVVGHLGAGTLIANGAGAASIGTLIVGLDAPATQVGTPPTSLVDLGGNLVTVTGDTRVGVGTPGRINLAGGTFTSNRLILGPTANVTGVVAQIGGALVTNADAVVADHGTATYTLDTLPNVIPTVARFGGALVIGAGAGTLGVGNGTFSLINGSLTVNASNAAPVGETIGDAGNGTFLQSGGTHRVNGAMTLGNQAGAKGFYRISGGTLNVGGVINVGQAGAGTMQLDGGRVEVPSVLRVRPTGNVNFNGGRIDLAPAGTGTLASGGGMIGDYTGGTTPLASLRAQIVSGYAGGAWTAPGITSSLAATTTGRAIGYAEATDIFSNFPATFMGQTGINNRTVLIRQTFAGDGNLDGTVDLTDFTFLAANFNGANRNWLQGDYNYDGKVDLTDFTFLAGNFNKSLSASAAMSVGTPVPEPTATVGYVATAVIAMGHARRRRRP
jgi:hypothetical protein